MFRIIFIVVAAAIAGLLLFAASRPDEFTVTRSLRMAAPPEKLFPLVNDFHGFNQWNPYLAKDPALKGSYSGPAAGPGAVYAWSGNKDVGQGSMEVTGQTPPTQVLMRLVFVEPFATTSTAEFNLQPQAGGTEVTWSMRGKHIFIGKLMSVFVDMDKMIGRDFETGLANLRALAEKP